MVKKVVQLSLGIFKKCGSVHEKLPVTGKEFGQAGVQSWDLQQHTQGTPCSVLNWCEAWWPKEWMLLPFHSFFKLVDFLKVGYVRALNKERTVSVNSALHCKSGQTRIYRWLKGTERTAGPIPSIYILEKVRPKNLLRAHKYHCRETQDQVLLLPLLTVLNQASC